ncbi:AAA family ATPase [Candidatus Woesearchaeota archaeon]|nr:AAA family ATPase [Candidatus Woesearchaeota archaeon]
MSLDETVRSKPRQDFYRRVAQRMQEKGFSVPSQGTTSAAHPVRKTPPAPVSRPVKKRPVVEQVRERPGVSPRDICHTVYTALHESGAIISADRSIKTGKVEYVDLSDNNSLKLRVADKSYNAPLLFTHLVALTERGSLLFTGTHGTGKTSSAELVSSFLFGKSLNEVRKAVIHGNPELTFSDMVAVTNLADLINKGIETVSPRAFMKAATVSRIIDEVNRLGPRQRSILYSIADKGEVQYRDKVICAPPGPLFATANPPDEGTTNLEKPFLDRYDISVKTRAYPAYYLKLVANARKLQDKLNYGLKGLKNVPHLTSKDVVQIRREIDAVEFDNDAMSRLVYFLAELNFCDRGGRELERKTKSDAGSKSALCSDCHYLTDLHICNQTAEGLSPRGYNAAYLYPKIFAWWQGKKKAGREEVELILPYVTRHRIAPTNQAVHTDPIYRTDTHAFAVDLIEKSGRAYEQDIEKFPELAQIPSIVYRVTVYGKKSGVDRKQVTSLLDKVKSIDSGARASIAVALNDAAERLR